ncbi:g205 [Coccomyxa viridis]|uniref:G205 protein n=1 Tax=Coccomyxa viridis TaxID=1274662 RepID=A0ABP1FKA7_9CHLO
MEAGTPELSEPESQVGHRKFYLYSTAQRYYLVARSKDRSAWSILKFNRDPELPTCLDVVEDPVTYTERECASLLTQIGAGNKAHGGLTFEVTGCYLLLVTKKRLHGSICAIELSKDFLWSYTWPLWRTVQANMSQQEQTDSAFNSMFVWNEFLTRHLRSALGNDKWVTPLIHGFWQRRSLAVLGQALTVTLIARRSRHFAGTRYRKRGVNDAGRVANEVEIEQVVDAGFDWRTGFPLLASLVQMRGSIPLYWVQDTASVSPINPKPAIQLQQYDPHYSATRLHFQDLADRYGKPLIVFNLVKGAEKRPRESILQSEFANAVSYINKGAAEEDSVEYIPWDFKYFAKLRGNQILEDMQPVIRKALNAMGMFVCPPSSPCPEANRNTVSSWEPAVRKQHGVLRTNCIDCLDRTNVAQFAAGLSALGRQLVGLGLAAQPDLDPRSSAASHLMSMYESMGNTLARQYGGSSAHASVFKHQRGDWQAATRMRDRLISLRRAINNGWYDDEKQGAINLFLGHFQPRLGQSDLWDLDSDHYLHSGLGRRSLLPSIPETIMSTTPTEATAVRNVLVSTISPEAAEQPGSGTPVSPTLEAALSRASPTQAKPIVRSAAAAPAAAEADAGADMQFPMSLQADARVAEGLTGAQHEEKEPTTPLSPFAAHSAADAHPLESAASTKGSLKPPLAGLIGRAASMKRLGSARPSSEAEEGKAGDAALRRQDIPGKPGSMLTQHGSGSMPAAGSHLESRPSSLDLGLLPPREMQIDVAPEQQPAASSLASVASVHKLAELAQPKAATEPATSNIQCSRSSTLALASVAASSPSLSAFENAPSMAASEPAAAYDSASGDVPVGEAAASKAAPSEQGAEEAAQAPDQALASPPSKVSGLTKYRAPTAPLQRSKLESFDRKIGRATNSLKEVRLQEAQPSRSYLPSWISKPLQRSRQPSYDSEISTSALPTPNLDNTIHGSLHGANNFGDKRWQSTGQPQPARRAPTPPSLRVLGSSDRWLGREELPVHEGVQRALSSPLSTSYNGSASPPVRANSAGIEDSFWSEPEPVAAMPRRSSFPALNISSLWKALPSSGQRPVQRAQSLGQPVALSRPASASLAEDIPARARLLGAAPARGQSRGETLGLQSHLLPYWQAGVDPTEAWHAYEKHIRVVYANLLEAAETQLHDSAGDQLRDAYTALTSPALTISLEGFAQGPGSSWRHANGLVGAKTFGEKELQRLAFDELTGAA